MHAPSLRRHARRQIIEDAAVHEQYCRVITPEPAINEETEEVTFLLQQCLELRRGPVASPASRRDHGQHPHARMPSRRAVLRHVAAAVPHARAGARERRAPRAGTSGSSDRRCRRVRCRRCRRRPRPRTCSRRPSTGCPPSPALTCLRWTTASCACGPTPAGPRSRTPCRARPTSSSPTCTGAAHPIPYPERRAAAVHTCLPGCCTGPSAPGCCLGGARSLLHGRRPVVRRPASRGGA